VVTEGRPEEWLGRVEAAMFGATKRALIRGLEDSKGGGGRAWMINAVCLGGTIALRCRAARTKPSSAPTLIAGPLALCSAG